MNEAAYGVDIVMDLKKVFLDVASEYLKDSAVASGTLRPRTASA
jgi:hypothetical protein